MTAVPTLPKALYKPKCTFDSREMVPSPSKILPSKSTTMTSSGCSCHCRFLPLKLGDITTTSPTSVLMFPPAASVKRRSKRSAPMRANCVRACQTAVKVLWDMIGSSKMNLTERIIDSGIISHFGVNPKALSLKAKLRNREQGDSY